MQGSASWAPSKQVDHSHDSMEVHLQGLHTCWSSLQMAATRSTLPVPLGSTQVARICWSLYLGSMLRLACTSTLSVNLREAACFSRSRACLGGKGLVLPVATQVKSSYGLLGRSAAG